MILAGIYLMSRVKTAKLGNKLSAFSTLVAITMTLVYMEVFTRDTLTILISIIILILIGTVLGIWLTVKVKMIEMPQVVAVLNGLGGATSAMVGSVTMFTAQMKTFELFTAILAVVIGVITLIGSLVAALKLSGKIDGTPIVLSFHQLYILLSFILLIACFSIPFFISEAIWWGLFLIILLSSIFSLLSTIRIGGADMPITISLLNSFSGVAGAIAGMAIGNVLLVAVGGVVGASGLILTQIMCQSMNRKLVDILLGKTSVRKTIGKEERQININNRPFVNSELSLSTLLKEAKRIVIVPGYGMALAQAQHLLKQLSDQLKLKGKDVKFAIHPVAGRMPGHMNVLLAEADVDYDELFEMERINDEFKNTDLVIVVGANDVINPAARSAKGTPIYGMPVLNVDEANHVIICNYDLKPGYAGVPNPLYESSENVTLLLGDAKESLQKLIIEITKS